MITLEGAATGLDFAIEELYATGWRPADPSGCESADNGRAYPGLELVRREFEACGHSLQTRHVQLFDCYRAQWLDAQGQTLGAVVGQSETEAAVYALSQFRRRSVPTG